MVVGHGMVAARFAEAVRRRGPDGACVGLTVLGPEPRPACNRVLPGGSDVSTEEEAA